MDEAWIKAFPGDVGYVGEKIPHHIGGSPITVPLPKSRHLDAHMPGGFRNNPGGPGTSGVRWSMQEPLLAYISGDYSDDDVRQLQSLAHQLSASGPWSGGPPRFVDEVDEASCTRPEDVPIRTVGLVLMVAEPRDERPTPVTEARRFVEALSQFTAARGVEFEMQLGQTYVGTIRSGGADRLVEEGLLARWGSVG